MGRSVDRYPVVYLLALATVVSACAGGSSDATGGRSTTSSAAVPLTTTAPATTVVTTTSTYPTVARPSGDEGYVWDACFRLREINLAVVRVEHSLTMYNLEFITRLVAVIQQEAFELAAQAEHTSLATAIGRWMDEVIAPDSGNEAEFDAALHTIGVVCAEYGLDRGVPGEIPQRPNSAEFGRLSACRDIFYPVPDGVVFANGEPYTVEDCMSTSQHALDAIDRREAYELTIDAFFELTPGLVCHGEQCWGPRDFSAR